MTEKLLTTEQVAAQLGIAVADVEQLVLEGRLIAYRLGGKYLRFRPDQVARAHAALRAPATPASTPTVPVADLSVFVSASADELPYTWPERVRDFIYFNDFYLIAVGLFLLVLYAIFRW